MSTVLLQTILVLSTDYYALDLCRLTKDRGVLFYPTQCDIRSFIIHLLAIVTIGCKYVIVTFSTGLLLVAYDMNALNKY